MVHDVYDVDKHKIGKTAKCESDLSKGEYLLKSVGWFHDMEGNWLVYRMKRQDKWSCYLETKVLSGEDGRSVIGRCAQEKLGIDLDPCSGIQMETFHLLDTEISALPWLRELYVFECDHLDIDKSSLPIRWISSEDLVYRILNEDVNIGLKGFFPVIAR